MSDGAIIAGTLAVLIVAIVNLTAGIVALVAFLIIAAVRANA